MNPSPSPQTPDGASEALAEVPPHLVARLAERAPDAGQPSRAVLTAALLRIQAQPHARVSGQIQRRPRRFHGPPAWAGWAVAAGLAVLLSWDHNRISSGREAGSGQARIDGSGGTPSPSRAHGGPRQPGAQAGSDSPEFNLFAENSTARAFGKSRQEANGNGKSRPFPLTAVQDMRQLRQDLSKLRASNDARFQPSPGLSRTVVVEMTDPTDPREANRQGTLKLSDRVAESIAAGVTAASSRIAENGSGTFDGNVPSPQTPPGEKPPEQDLVLSGGDGSWSGDIVIEKGLPNTGLLNLPEGTQIKHLDFPVESASNYRGLQDLGSGWFYDQFSDVLWQPTGEGKTYIGQKAPAGFDAEVFSPPASASPQLAENPTMQAPAGSTGPSQQPPAETPATVPGSAPLETAANLPPVRGYPIFDETTGSGSIILQNLAAAGAGQSYQLWITDAAAGQPVSVGLLPALDAGNGRVWFDLGGPGVAPSGYLLTEEPATGSTVPTGRVVLQGP